MTYDHIFIAISIAYDFFVINFIFHYIIFNILIRSPLYIS
jgi:hypothetical protein